jgi:myo-inositol-1(or 4)-monophosphatase
MDGFGRVQDEQISLKGRGDYVTELDHQSESVILKEIKTAFPEHGILAEESGSDCSGTDTVWVIDPLDGTANYVQSIPMFCVSIGVQHRLEMVAGVVYDPVRDEMFSAVRGMGAELNGQPISVSSRSEMSHAMLASGFPWRSKSELDAYLKSFRTLFLMSAGLRRMGAAALDLAYTACGRFDGFWEMRLHPWDIAAGSILVEEAGGRVTDFTGNDAFLRSGNVVAGNTSIHSHLCHVLRAVDAAIE